MNIRKQKSKFFTAFFILVFAGLFAYSVFYKYQEYKRSPISGIELAAVDKNADTQTQNGQIPVFSEIMNSVAIDSDEDVAAGQIFFRLFIALFLASLLAFRPKKSVRLFQRNFHVAQTQILLAVVAASLMMIVGNNAARAFAIFAAVSIVRFRTNIKDPKEITVLLVCLAVGLGAGVGYWQLATVLCFFVIALLWFLEFKEDENAFRTMELVVKTSDAKETKGLLKEVFEKFELEAELRRIDLPLENREFGKLSFLLNIPLRISTDVLTHHIIKADAENIADVEWCNKQKELQIYE